MQKKRKLLLLVLLTLLAAVAGRWVYVFLNDDDRLMKAKYDKIQLGMTLDEIQTIMGRPWDGQSGWGSGWHAVGNHVKGWNGPGTLTIDVLFNEVDDTLFAVEKRLRTTEEPLLTRLQHDLQTRFATPTTGPLVMPGSWSWPSQKLPSQKDDDLDDHGRPGRVFSLKLFPDCLMEDQLALIVIQRLGGEFIREGGARGPIVEVRWGSNTGPDDQALAYLPGLKSLRRLEIAGQRLTDIGLGHLARCENLERLSIHHAPFSDAGFMQLQKMRSLRELELSYMKVTEAALGSLEALPVLERIRLTGETFTGKGGPHLSRLKHLRSLNYFLAWVVDDGLQELQNHPSLEELDLCGCRGVTKKGLAQLTSVPLLQSLHLYQCGIADADLALLRQFPRLRKLSLGGPDLTDAGMQHLEELTNLHSLNLGWYERLGDKGLKCLEPLKDLEELDLSQTRVTDRGLAGLRGMTKLKKLSLLTNKKIVGWGFAYLVGIGPTGEPLPGTGLQDLRELQLNYTSVDDSVMEYLARFSRLEYLGLSNTKITGSALEGLAGFSQLKKLDLWDLPIADADLAPLKSLTNLEELDLSYTRVTAAGLEQLLPSLKHLRRLRVEGVQMPSAAARKIREAFPDLEMIRYR